LAYWQLHKQSNENAVEASRRICMPRWGIVCKQMYRAIGGTLREKQEENTIIEGSFSKGIHPTGQGLLHQEGHHF